MNTKLSNFLLSLFISAVGLTVSACNNDSKEQTRESKKIESANMVKKSYGDITGSIHLDLDMEGTASNAQYLFQVKAIHLADQTEYETVTNTLGKYQFHSLPVGEYQIIAKHDAYKKSGSTTTVITKNRNLTVNILLK